MTTLNDLLARKYELEQQIAVLQQESRDRVIGQIHSLLADVGLTIRDMNGLGVFPASPTPRRRAPIKYRHPATGQSWSGRGMKPRWLASEIANGHSIEEFTV